LNSSSKVQVQLPLSPSGFPLHEGPACADATGAPTVWLSGTSTTVLTTAAAASAENGSLVRRRKLRGAACAALVRSDMPFSLQCPRYFGARHGSRNGD
jgi:hypothetical protein